MTTTQRHDRHTARVTRVLGGTVLATGLVAVAASAVLAGTPGVLGALIGLALVAFLLGFTSVALKVLARPANGATLLIALLLYATNALFVVALAVVLTRSGLLGDAISSTALGVTLLAGTLIGTLVAVVGTVTSRQPLYDLGVERR